MRNAAHPGRRGERSALAALGLILAVALLAVSAVSVGAFPNGPLPGVTGGFSEGTCNASGCHNSFQLNAGRTEKLGDVLVSGLPKEYTPGATYSVRLVISHTEDRMAWGFQLATRLKDTGAQAGTLKPTDGATQVLEDKGIQYIEHTIDGIVMNTFDFTWTAPSEPRGAIVVHAAANAADGGLAPDADYVYTTEVTIAPPPP